MKSLSLRVNEMRLPVVFLMVSLSSVAWGQGLGTPPKTPGFTAPPQSGTPAAVQPAAAATPAVTDVSSVTVAKTAKPDRDVFIGSYITLDKTCKVGATPTVEFTQQPANGKIRSRRDAVNLQSAPGVPRNKCLGVSPAGIAVMYRSNRKAKGDDTFAYRVTYPDGRVREVSGTVTVQ